MARLVITLDDSTFSRLALPYVKNAFEPRYWSATLLHVAPFASPSDAGNGVDQVRRELDQAFSADADALRNAGFDSSISIRFGQDVVREVIRYGSEGNADVFVMAAHRRSAASRLFRLSVAERVLRLVEVPVFLVHCDEHSSDHDADPARLTWSRVEHAIPRDREQADPALIVRGAWLQRTQRSERQQGELPAAR